MVYLSSCKFPSIIHNFKFWGINHLNAERSHFILRSHDRRRLKHFKEFSLLRYLYVLREREQQNRSIRILSYGICFSTNYNHTKKAGLQR